MHTYFQRIILFLILLTGLTSCNQKEVTPHCQERELIPSEPYAFFVAGHVYGIAGSTQIGMHPPFVEKFDFIRSYNQMDFGVLTGDIVFNGTIESWDGIDAKINELDLPVYFAVGNHDMTNRPLFEQRYGSTYSSFIHNGDLFIILDPNLNSWSISGEQLTFLKNTLNDFSNQGGNIHVFFHQLLWWENDNIYSNVRLNSWEGRSADINFWTEVEPLFKCFGVPVYMYAGDVGAANWSDDFMYHQYDNIHLIASGMGEGIGDNFLIVKVDSNKTVDFDLIPLNDSEDLGNLEDYKLP